MLPATTAGRQLPLSAVTLLLAALTSGCLGHLYEIPRSELERLVQAPPEQRGQSIYAIQQFSTAPEPAPAAPLPPPEGEPPLGYVSVHSGYWLPSVYVDYGVPAYSPRVPVNRFHEASPIGTSTSDESAAPEVPSVDGVKDGGPLLVAAIVVGVGVGVALAASEGLRYDGQVAVHPHHPVHLKLHQGGQRIVRLDELTAEHLRESEEAVLVAHEGAGMWLLGGAPLNRPGFSYQFGAGNDSLALPRFQTVQSPGFRFALGYFPLRQLGLLVESRLQRGNDGANSFHNVRLGLEAQGYPIALGRLHLGAFAGTGQSWFGSSGPSLPATDSSRAYVSFGALAELELATRLGLTLRWGADWLPAPSAETQRLAISWSLGLAIY